MDWLVPVFMGLMGAGIAGIWTSDILRGRGVNLSQGVFRAREPDADTLFWPHWLAEYGTAASLIVAAIGIKLDLDWGRELGLLAIGALLYTSTNALGWAFADRSRLSYAFPMMLGALGGLACAAVLLVE